MLKRLIPSYLVPVKSWHWSEIGALTRKIFVTRDQCHHHCDYHQLHHCCKLSQLSNMTMLAECCKVRGAYLGRYQHLDVTETSDSLFWVIGWLAAKSWIGWEKNLWELTFVSWCYQFDGDYLIEGMNKYSYSICD